jgi:hypothetical protein
MAISEARRRANAKYDAENTRRMSVTFTRANDGFELNDFVKEYGGSTYLRALATLDMERIRDGKVIDPALYSEGHHVIEDPDGNRVHYDVDENGMVVDACASGGTASRVREAKIVKYVDLPTWAPMFVRNIQRGIWKVVE